MAQSCPHMDTISHTLGFPVYLSKVYLYKWSKIKINYDVIQKWCYLTKSCLTVFLYFSMSAFCFTDNL